MKEYQLPKEFATKWVEALRSGKYSQSPYQLHSKSGYCCLGVACSISGYEDLGEAQFISKTGIHPLREKDIGLLNVIPVALQGGTSNDLVEFLTDMNDTGKSFPEIADWIEENVEFV